LSTFAFVFKEKAKVGEEYALVIRDIYNKILREYIFIPTYLFYLFTAISIENSITLPFLFFMGFNTQEEDSILLPTYG